MYACLPARQGYGEGENMFQILLLIVGFALLIKGAGWLVDGASSIAKRFGVSNLVIGLTIVAFGTSAPELATNIVSVLRGAMDIALGNIIGSNIANILLILGITAIIHPLVVQKSTTLKEIPLSFLAALVIGLMINDARIDGFGISALSRIDGLILLCFFVIFMYYTFGIARQKNGSQAEEHTSASRSVLMALLMVACGLAALVIGGRFTVDAAVWMARFLGASESLIGLTIVAVGTSLPELATSAVAASKKNFDIAMGNIIGSNIFNIFFILGISAVMRPLSPSVGINADIFVAGAASLILMIAILHSGKSTLFGKRHELTRAHGFLFLLLYAGYIGYLINRG